MHLHTHTWHLVAVLPVANRENYPCLPPLAPPPPPWLPPPPEDPPPDELCPAEPPDALALPELPDAPPPQPWPLDALEKSPRGLTLPITTGLPARSLEPTARWNCRVL